MTRVVLSTFIVFALLQRCSAEINDRPEAWYSANVITDPSYSPKPIQEMFSKENAFSTANPIVVVSSTEPTKRQENDSKTLPAPEAQSSNGLQSNSPSTVAKPSSSPTVPTTGQESNVSTTDIQNQSTKNQDQESNSQSQLLRTMSGKPHYFFAYHQTTNTNHIVPAQPNAATQVANPCPLASSNLMPSNSDIVQINNGALSNGLQNGPDPYNNFQSSPNPNINNQNGPPNDNFSNGPFQNNNFPNGHPNNNFYSGPYLNSNNQNGPSPSNNFLNGPQNDFPNGPFSNNNNLNGLFSNNNFPNGPPIGPQTNNFQNGPYPNGPFPNNFPVGSLNNNSPNGPQTNNLPNELLPNNNFPNNVLQQDPGPNNIPNEPCLNGLCPNNILPGSPGLSNTPNGPCTNGLCQNILPVAPGPTNNIPISPCANGPCPNNILPEGSCLNGLCPNNILPGSPGPSNTPNGPCTNGLCQNILPVAPGPTNNIPISSCANGPCPNNILPEGSGPNNNTTNGPCINGLCPNILPLSPGPTTNIPNSPCANGSCSNISPQGPNPNNNIPNPSRSPSGLYLNGTLAPQVNETRSGIPYIRIRMLTPGGSITKVAVNPPPKPTSTRRPTTTRRRRRNNNYDACVDNCGDRIVPICAGPLGGTLQTIDPDSLKGFPTTCHLACHNSFRKNLYEKVIDGRCSRLRNRIHQLGSNSKLPRVELNKAQYTVVNNPGTVIEVSQLQQ